MHKKVSNKGQAAVTDWLAGWSTGSETGAHLRPNEVPAPRVNRYTKMRPHSF